MTIRQRARKLNQSIERDGSKNPVKQYSWDEIDEVDQDSDHQFELTDPTAASRAHTRLHWAWNDNDLPDWTYDEIIAEHARVVNYLTDQGNRHVLTDSLDRTLPENLKELSINPNYDLSFLTGVKNETIELLERIDIDSITKLKRADAAEVAEKLELRQDYIERLQENAEAV